MDCLQQITQEIQVLKQQNQETHEHQKQIDETVALIQERLQENNPDDKLPDSQRRASS